MTPRGPNGDPRVVALGGGHGLAASLSALRQVTTELTAVVTVADNGGSSGRLRNEFGGLPPGDLRMALTALCGDDRWGRTWAEVLHHRFESGGELNGHAVGNLLIVALWELLGDHVQGLEWVAGLLGARGRVLPMSTEAIHISGVAIGLDPRDPGALTEVHGQKEVATTPNLVSVSLDPTDPPACPEAIEAVLEADVVVLGPGSWFTSVLPHLLVPGLRDALSRSSAKVVVVMNLVAEEGETQGLAVEDHLEVFRAHAPGLGIDVVLADPSSVSDVEGLRSYVEAVGARLVMADVHDEARPGQHDPSKLARAYAALVSPT